MHPGIRISYRNVTSQNLCSTQKTEFLMKSQEKNQELTKAVIQLEPIQTKDEVVFGGFTDVLVATFSEGSTYKY